MKIFKLERSQILSISLEEAWAYFSNPNNLAEITPPSLSLRIKNPLQSTTYSGLIIEYTVKPLWGIEMGWVSEIKHVKAPFYFVDEQRAGPYQFWYHQHIFKAIDQKQVEIIDIVHYALPVGIFSSLINGLMVEPKLNEIFNFRKGVLAAKFKR